MFFGFEFFQTRGLCPRSERQLQEKRGLSVPTCCRAIEMAIVPHGIKQQCVVCSRLLCSSSATCWYVVHAEAFFSRERGDFNSSAFFVGKKDTRGTLIPSGNLSTYPSRNTTETLGCAKSPHRQDIHKDTTTAVPNRFLRKPNTYIFRRRVDTL